MPEKNLTARFKMNKKRKVTGKSVYLTEKELDLIGLCISEMEAAFDYPFREDEKKILDKGLSKLNKAMQSIKEQQSDD